MGVVESYHQCIFNMKNVNNKINMYSVLSPTMLSYLLSFQCHGIIVIPKYATEMFRALSVHDLPNIILVAPMLAVFLGVSPALTVMFLIIMLCFFFLCIGQNKC